MKVAQILYKRLDWLLEDTSIHGLRFLRVQSPALERVIWLLVVSLCSYFAYDMVWSFYLESKVVIVKLIGLKGIILMIVIYV